MNRRIKIKGLKLDVYNRPPVMPDIMRPCVNPETASINSKTIEENIAKIYKRLDDLVIKIRERKLDE